MWSKSRKIGVKKRLLPNPFPQSPSPSLGHLEKQGGTGQLSTDEDTLPVARDQNASTEKISIDQVLPSPY